MGDSKELKPKSFRIDDETAEKFKEISVSIGASQQETLSKLIEAFEFQKGKAILTDRKADIEQFEKYTSCLVRMYMGVLEDNQNVTDTVRMEFDALLKSKDSIIQELQSQLTTAKQLKEEAVKKAKAHSEENDHLKKTIESLRTEYDSKLTDIQSMVKDKDNLNNTLTFSCNELKAKVESMRADAEQNKLLQQKLNTLKVEYDKVNVSLNTLEGDLRQEKEKYDKSMAEMKKCENEALQRVREQSQLDFDRKMLEIEKKYEGEIQQLKTDKQKEIDKYQSKYFDLLQKLQGQGSEQSKVKTSTKKSNQ